VCNMHLRMLVAIVNTLRYANGDSAVKSERVQLDCAVQVKLRLWRADRSGFDRNAYVSATYYEQLLTSVPRGPDGFTGPDRRWS
jgi:hypothetical protein